MSSDHKCQPLTRFTILAGVVTQCPHCKVVHRVDHKTVVEEPLGDFDDPQVTFEEWMEVQVRNVAQDEYADSFDHDASQEDDPQAGF